MSAAVQRGFDPGEIDYPGSDGEPIGETDFHIDEILDTRAVLKERYRDAPDTYVAGNLLIYYEEGNIGARFAPDAFVVFGVPKRRRRVYKLWEEKRTPAFVLEVTSRQTRLEDKGSKKELCAELGVEEYFLFDPEQDYMKPPLQGFRLVGGRYDPIAPDAQGRVLSNTLGLLLALDAGRLRLIDPATGELLVRPDEQVARAERAEARAAGAEAEVAKRRALLERR